MSKKVKKVSVESGWQALQHFKFKSNIARKIS